MESVPELTLQEENPTIPFVFRDTDGNIIFRDALTFASISELRNTSQAERTAMMQERFNNWQTVANTPTQGPEEQSEEAD